MNTDNNSQKSPLTNKVLDKLQSGQIKMHPKKYFILKTALIVLSVIIVAFFTLYLISFIIFAMRASGAWYLPNFGFYGLKAFLAFLPWLLILMAAALIIVLEILVKHFSFAYRRPIFYSALGIIIITLSGSLVIDKTRFHSNLFRGAQEGSLPVAGKIYRGFGMAKCRDAHRGAVSKITNDGFLIETRRSETLTVIITPDTRFPFAADIKENDNVIIFGKRDNGTIQAFGVRKINDDLNIVPRRRIQMRLDK